MKKYLFILFQIDYDSPHDYADYLEPIMASSIKEYFSLLIEDQGVQAGLREYGYWILTKYLQIKSYEEYLERYDEIRKFSYHNLNNNFIIP